MKNEGKKFEKLIRDNSKEEGLYYLRLQDNLKLGVKVEGARFSQRSPYDSVLFGSPYLYCLELKSVGTTSLSYGDRPSCNIKAHQINSLLAASQFDNVFAGFLIQFRKRITKTSERDEKVFFVEINKFKDFTENNDKKSISYEDCKKIGIIAPSLNVGKRVVKYKYLIKELLVLIIEDSKKKRN